MTAAEFFGEYRKAVDAALEWGVRNTRPRTSADPRAFSAAEQRAFFRNCHRGFERAQHRIVALLEQLNADDVLDRQTRDYYVLLLRGVADAVAVQMLAHQAYMVRRLVLHDGPPELSVPTVKAALVEANRLNAESRQTFALLADLTTFAHVGDIIRVDHRGRDPRISFIELKTGRVNTMLLNELERYRPDPSSIADVDADQRIEPRHRAQAKRMMRQRVRLAQVQEVMDTDAGTDIKFNVPVRLTTETVVTQHFDGFLASLLRSARENRIAGGSVSWCLHVGVAYANTPENAQRGATFAVRSAAGQQRAQIPLVARPAFDEIAHLVRGPEQIRLVDSVKSNLAAPVMRPILTWDIPRDLIYDLLEERAAVMIGFDLPAFVALAAAQGVKYQLASRRDTAQIAKHIGSHDLPTWAHRALTYPRDDGAVVYVQSGFLSRLVNDLTTPHVLLRQYHNASTQQPPLPG